MTNIKVKKLTLILSWAVVLLWLGLIVYLSAQPGAQSNNLRIGTAQSIKKTVQQVIPDASFNIKSFNHLLRKTAHFLAYFFLGGFVINASRKSSARISSAFLLALAICVIFAISDELHQLFVSGRSAQVKDVLIDSAGAIVGIGSYVMIDNIKKKGMVSKF